MTKDDALDLALEVLNILAYNSGDEKYTQAITVIKQVRALDKKAENARELGLGYEPVWNNLPSNKDVEDAMQMKRLNQLTSPPAAPVQQKPLFADIIAQHPGLAEELKAMDAAPVQEPVAIALNTGTKQGVKWLENVEHGEKLYTTPPAQRTWVGLTTEDMATCIDEPAWDLVLRKAEKILKEKNT